MANKKSNSTQGRDPLPEHFETLEKVFLELKIPVLDKDEAYLSLKKKVTR